MAEVIEPMPRSTMDETVVRGATFHIFLANFALHIFMVFKYFVGSW